MKANKECSTKKQTTKNKAMTSTLKESTLRTWVDESFIDQRFNQKSNLQVEKVCPKIITNFDFTEGHAKDTETSVSNKKRRGKRWSTERWLEEMIGEFDINFQDFISISFHKPNKDIINQYLDAGHIKNVILDFYYKKNRPENKIKIWIIVEREGMFFRQGKNLELEPIFTGDLHFHILMERVDLDWWLATKNRDITLKKKHLHNFYKGHFPTKEQLMRETLINHLKQKVHKIPKSKQGVDIRDFGEIKKRIHYVNKSLSSVEFDKWEHIDFEHSDLPVCPLTRPINLIHSK